MGHQKLLLPPSALSPEQTSALARRQTSGSANPFALLLLSQPCHLPPLLASLNLTGSQSGVRNIELRREGPYVWRTGNLRSRSTWSILEGLCIFGGNTRNPGSVAGVQERCKEGELYSDKPRVNSSQSLYFPHKACISFVQTLSHNSV